MRLPFGAVRLPGLQGAASVGGHFFWPHFPRLKFAPFTMQAHAWCPEPKHNDQYRHAYGDHWDYDSDGNPQQQRQPIYGDGGDVDAPPELHASLRRWEPNRLTNTTIPTKTAKDDTTLTQPVACFDPVGFVFEAGGRLLFL